jgi:type IV pilus assembly protein PilY1
MKRTQIKTIIKTLILTFGLQTMAHASLLALATKPLFVSTSVSPNLTILLDDSGSMASAYVPDALSSSANYRRFLSNYFNALAYDPSVAYQLPVKADTTTYSTSFTKAYINGFDTSRGYVNISTSYRPTTSYNPSSTSQTYSNNPSQDFSSTTSSNPAYYYIRDNSLPNCTASNDSDEDCYKKVAVTSTSGTGPAGKDERQNFAIWYSFYRTRNLTIVSGASLALKNLDPSVRIAWTSLNTCTTFGTSCAGWDGVKLDNKIRPFTGTQRSNFYSWISRLPASNGTPLRSGLIRIGDYYSTSGITSPYAQDPQVTDGIESTCRQNYSMLMTDGIWNTDNPSIGNLDNTDKTLPDGTHYQDMHPYKDNNSSSLADIAFKYWENDLRTDLSNDVTPFNVDQSGTTAEQYFNAKNDPATWQHMVTFTVGLGLSDGLGQLGINWQGNTYTGEYPNFVTGATAWPTTGSEQAGNVADLWHAAIDSRGQFFASERPQDIINAFQSIVARVNSGVGASGSIASNTTSIRKGTNIYQARFNSGDWTGDLLSIPLSSTGTLPVDLLTASTWRATDTITNTTPTTRVILTNKSSTNKGIPFKWPASSSSPTSTELDTTQTAKLNINPDSFATDTLGNSRLNYIRGDRTLEGTTFRTRNSLLGDIIDSAPLLLDPPSNPAITDHSYITFRTNNASRPTIVYIGANDGMLHGVKVSDGTEVLSYVPGPVIANLNKLTSSYYTHQFYVDGILNTNDVKFTDGSWHSILVGGMGNGGRGIFTLDVTDPTSFTEDNASKIAKFEYTDAQDSDVGYIRGTPTIIKANNGKYVAIFGNGYNSTGTGAAMLFIVDIETGALIKKITTNVGTTTTPNGLASPALVDLDGNGTADYAYAGDLLGNMWKFDISDSNPANWKVAFSGSPLFAAGKPITEQPDITPSPYGGEMVFFGTGKYLESSDTSDVSVNNFYGIQDNGVSIVNNISLLQQQTITTATILGGVPYRSVSQNPVDYTTQRGWYLTLPASGERSITDPLVNGGKIDFTTTIPNGSGCSFGGTSWLMEIDYLTGGATNSATFDTNNDGTIDAKDLVYNGLGLSAISSAPTLLQGLGSQNTPLDRVFLNESNGTISSTLQSGSRLSSRRTSWMQIIN